MKFSDLSLSPNVLKALQDMGFENATEIQYKTIPTILEGKDIIGQAQTGTGKTAAFGIPIIEMTDVNSKDTTSLIISPTRELALQITNELQKMAQHVRGINIVTVYGGDDIVRQMRLLKKGAQIVVGTPGRIKDLINRGALQLHTVENVVLDEADEMLNMGFKEDIIEILSNVPEERQTILFSATLPPAILAIANDFLNDAVHIKVIGQNITANTIEQCYMNIGDSSKVELLLKLMDLNAYKLVLCFCNTKRKADEVVLELSTKGGLAEALHGDLTQAQRNKVMQKFREGRIKILVATDVAARGIDVNDVDAVFNIDVPFDYEYYVHRIGRTGRAGKLGKAYSFIGGRNEMMRLREIERYIKNEIIREELPTEKEIAKRNLKRYKDRLTKIDITENETFYNEILHDIEQDCEFTHYEIALRLLHFLIPVPKKSSLEVPKSIESPKKQSGKSNFGEKRREYSPYGKRKESDGQKPKFNSGSSSNNEYKKKNTSAFENKSSDKTSVKKRGTEKPKYNKDKGKPKPKNKF
jgi:ATP-dependent RNA helicase DeaD